MEFLLSATTPNWLTIILALIAVLATIITGLMPYLLQKRQNSDFIKRKKLLLIQDFDLIAELISKLFKFNLEEKRYAIMGNSQTEEKIAQIIEKLKLNYVDFLVLFSKKNDDNYTKLISAVGNLHYLLNKHTYGKGSSITVTDQAKAILVLKDDIQTLIRKQVFI